MYIIHTSENLKITTFSLRPTYVTAAAKGNAQTVEHSINRKSNLYYLYIGIVIFLPDRKA